jgi:hypothetical protein
VIREQHTRNIGYCFDIGHATVEGGLSWPIQARLAEPYYISVYMKDFIWEKGPEGWSPTWCPLGEGVVDRSFGRPGADDRSHAQGPARTPGMAGLTVRLRRLRLWRRLGGAGLWKHAHLHARGLGS